MGTRPQQPWQAARLANDCHTPALHALPRRIRPQRRSGRPTPAPPSPGGSGRSIPRLQSCRSCGCSYRTRDDKARQRRGVSVPGARAGQSRHPQSLHTRNGHTSPPCRSVPTPCDPLRPPQQQRRPGTLQSGRSWRACHPSPERATPRAVRARK